MSRTPQATESERIMAQAQSMIDKAGEGLAQGLQALRALGIDSARIAVLHDAAIARGAPIWMEPTAPIANAPAPNKAPNPLRHDDTRRDRKHRFMV